MSSSTSQTAGFDPTEQLDLLPKISISLAEDADRPAIYALRHQVYALELGQHAANADEQLSDSLDAYNIYLKASVGGRIAGFVSITPPGRRYSVEKYVPREEFAFPFDGGLYEVRLLTVVPGHRNLPTAGLLMYAALRWIEVSGGTRIVVIGRREILSLYRKAGLRPAGALRAIGSCYLPPAFSHCRGASYG